MDGESHLFGPPLSGIAWGKPRHQAPFRTLSGPSFQAVMLLPARLAGTTLGGGGFAAPPSPSPNLQAQPSHPQQGCKPPAKKRGWQGDYTVPVATRSPAPQPPSVGSSRWAPPPNPEQESH